MPEKATNLTASLPQADVTPEQIMAAKCVTQARLAAQLPIDADMIVAIGIVWARILTQAKIPVELWGKCADEAIKTHTGYYPLQVGQVVAAYEEVKISLVDHRTIKQQITDFNNTRPARVENYGKHLELATWLKDMKQTGFNRQKIATFLNSKLSDRNYYFDLELLSVLTKEAKISETEWARLQLDVARVDFGVK